MTKIKAVIFDQGGVLSVGGEKGTNENAATKAMGLESTIVIPDLLEDLKRGHCTNAEFVEAVNRRYPMAPRKLTNNVWKTIHAGLVKEPKAYWLAGRCRSAGLRVGLLSNINPGVAELLRADGSYDGFDPLVLSCYTGFAKPDPEVYVTAEKGLPGIEPSEILLLDDQEKCITGARRRGWQAIHVTDIDQMIRDTSRLIFEA